MKIKKKGFCVFLLLMSFFFCDDVFALKCNYNYSGYKTDSAVWSVDSSEKKPANMEINIFGGLGTDAGREPVLNWDESLAGNYTAKSDFNSNKCPDYLIQKYTGAAYEVYMANEKSLMAILNTDDVQKHGWGADSSVIVFKNANRTKPSKKAVVCKYTDPDYSGGLAMYESFTLNYDENGNLLSSDFEASDSLLNSAFLISYTAFETPLKSNSCNTTAYLCSSMFVSHGDSGYPYYEVFLNAQGFLEEDKSHNADSGICIQFKFDQEGSTSESGEKPGYDSACEAVNTYLTELETYAKQYKKCKEAGNCVNGGSMNEFTRTEEMLQTYCNSVYKVSYYSDSCAQACVGIDTEIAKIKVANKMGVGDGGAGSCSLSKRAVSWIFKIVKWVRYLVPILLIMLSIMDFIKAVASDSEDEMRKVGAKFVKRLIVAAIIFILPLILEFLLGIFGIATNNYCL